jgi:hypothetical protein
MADVLSLFRRRLSIGDSVLVPARVRTDGRHRIEGYIGARVFRQAVWVRTTDLSGDVMLRVKVKGFRLSGLLVEVEAAISGLRQGLLVPRWSVKPDSNS